MELSELNRQARRYYRRYYRLMAVAMVVMTMVVTGSVVLGDSVRNTLLLRVTERLGQTQTVISSGQGLLSDSILLHQEMSEAHGYLVAEGFVASEGRMLPVMVWGTDEDGIAMGQASVNETLWQELGEQMRVVVHLPSNNIVPSGSLFISQRYTTTMRVDVNGVKAADEGGNRWLHNEQMRPMNVFVNRQEMAELMGTEGRVNLILSDKAITKEEFTRCWKPAYSGLRHHTSLINQQPSATVTSERVFLPQNVVDALQPQEVYQAYFVNRIGNTLAEGAAVPYSFVTATSRLTGDSVVLSDWAARRTGAAVGDSVEMEYYVVKGLKKLETRTHRFVVKAIVPLTAFMDDQRLKADFPGLSNVKRCTDWDSDLPIDMSKIKKEDEDYWAQYRQTPKAIVGWEAVKDDWSNAYGVATAVTLNASPDTAAKSVEEQPPLFSQLTPELLGVTVTSPRQEAMLLAEGGTDFTSLFLALGFFILVSAALLMLNPLLEMYHARRDELQMYALLGFDRRAVRKLLFREAAQLLCVVSPLGVLAGCLYASLSLWLLSGAWRGATHTDAFTFHLNPLNVGIAWLAALLIGLATVWIAQNTRSSRNPRSSQKPKLLLGGGLLLVLLLLLNVFVLHSMLLFVVCGFLWILCAGWLGQWLVVRQHVRLSARPLSRPFLWWSALAAHLPRHRVAFWTLATGVFVVFAVGLNRPDADHSSTEATGGYAMYAECRVPIYYDLNSPSVRRHLKLDDLGTQVRFLQMPKHREDEASCLNLNKVATPSVLALDKGEMAAFGIDTTLFSTANGHNAAIPAVLDEEALMWSVQKRVGDTLHYVAGDGSTVNVVIAGSYPLGVHHGHLLMLRHHFSRLWPEENGNSVLMATADVSDVLKTALADYGVEAVPVSERMALLLEVTDTYLSIFMALGGLGLLLGIVSLAVVLRKHLAARQQETALFAVLGATPEYVARLLRSENMLPVLYAILIGAVGSLISISASMSAIHKTTWLMAAVLLSLALTVTILFINYIINPKKLRK